MTRWATRFEWHVRTIESARNATALVPGASGRHPWQKNNKLMQSCLVYNWMQAISFSLVNLNNLMLLKLKDPRKQWTNRL